MDKQRIGRLIEQVAITMDNELDCDAAAELMLQAAEAGSNSDEDLALHLRLCSSCLELYNTLVEICHLEKGAGLPDTALLWRNLRHSSTTAAAFEHISAADGSATLGTEPPIAISRTSDEVSRLADSQPPSPLKERSTDPRRPRRISLLAPAPAALVLTALLAIGGWWQVIGKGAELERLRAHVQTLDEGNQQGERLRELVSLANTFAYHRMDSGAWARIVYHNDLDRAMVYAGQLPTIDSGERIVCWLVDQMGKKVKAWEADALGDGDQEWWPIEADRPLGSFMSLVITQEPRGDVVLEVPLVADSG